MKHTVKNIEILAIIMILLAVVSKISSPVMSWATAWFLGAGRQVDSMNHEWRMMLTVWNVLYLLVNLGVAVWLFVSAKEERRSKWIWAMFGLFYGLTAAVLYFLLDVIEEIRGLRNKDSEQTGSSDGSTRA